ncbi:hypothetical protein [Leifsonia poae]|uniref:DNA helicase n=1 Tax=Leifsonia poae TaxID=110933 RepID=A0A9W6LZE6_9MICO|nr:hypothetical protein [Leifsonia poae]GLJ75855.1 hypothetical protein GCM10017584_14290 [Leifsonia poae]
MSLTRKRKKELKRLRSSAEELWGAQQEVLANANALASEARRQANYYTREELAPRVRDGYDQYVRPATQTASRVAGVARDRLVTDVIPAVGATIGTAMSVVDHARDARARAFIGDVKKAGSEVSKRAQDVSKRAQAVTEKSGPGAGTVIAVGLGIIAAVGLLYAVWQTFRADDELWVADEEPTAPAAE